MIFTVKQAAERLSVSERRIRKLCADGRLGVKVGRQWLIKSQELAEFRAKPVGNPEFGNTSRRA